MTGQEQPRDDSFIGREDLLEIARGNLCQPGKAGYLAMFGPKGIGKTTALERIQRLVAEAVPGTVAIWWRGNERSTGDFRNEMRARLRRELEGHVPQLGADLDIEEILRAADRASVKVLMIFDNFHEIAAVWRLGLDHFGAIRAWVEDASSKRAVSLVVSSHVPLRELSLEFQQSGLYGRFHDSGGEQRLRGLARGDATALAEQVLAAAGGPRGIDLYAYCHGHPALTRHCARAILKARAEKRRPRIQDLYWAVTDDLDRLARSLDEKDLPAVGQIVRRVYPVVTRELTAAAEALVRSGLCRRVREDDDSPEGGIAPAGALAAVYLRRRFLGERFDDEPATSEECDYFKDISGKFEHLLHAFIRHECENVMGPGWPQILPSKPAEKYARAAGNGPATFDDAGFTLGDLISIERALPDKRRIFPDQEQARKTNLAGSLVVRWRNGFAHTGDGRALRGEMDAVLAYMATARRHIENLGIF